MRSGRTYEVLVDGKQIGLVGSTIRPLSKRRIGGYTKRFGDSVELKLIREIPIPTGYTEKEYDFRLKAAEAFDIVRKKTYTECGGLNKFSPLAQALWLPKLQTEIGKIGANKRHKMYPNLSSETAKKHAKKMGKIGGRKNVESGHIRNLCRQHNMNSNHQKIASAASHAKRTQEQKVEWGRKGGNRHVVSGHLASLRTPEHQSNAGKRGARVGNHIKNCLNKGIVNLKCEVCFGSCLQFLSLLPSGVECR